MPIFEIKNIKYCYNQYETSKYAIDDVSFNINKKEILALIGESGSGKSTLISHLNGIYKANSGDILYNGKSIYDKDFNLTELRFKCGVVFQYPEYQLFSDTVLEDVAFGAIKKGLSEEEAYKRSIGVLKELGIEHLKNESPFNLSGGEKRKVAFAGIFAMDPEVLIFDEPDAGLDSVSKRKFYSMIVNLNKKFGTTILFTTHNLDDVVEYADRVVVLNEGKLMADGKPFDIFSNESIMKECNLERPYAIDIYNEVKKYGKEIDSDKLRFNELIESLTNLK